MFPILGSLLTDPKFFPNPKDFNPQNFLDNRGQLKKNAAFVPFSIGKETRACWTTAHINRVAHSLSGMHPSILFLIQVSVGIKLPVNQVQPHTSNSLRIWAQVKGSIGLLSEMGKKQSSY